MPQVLDIEQAVLLLEIDPPFGKRDIQLARRRQAKRWHPDIAPPGKQTQHERHLKAVNEAADQLERLAEDSRGGRVTRNAVFWRLEWADLVHLAVMVAFSLLAWRLAVWRMEKRLVE